MLVPALAPSPAYSLASQVLYAQAARVRAAASLRAQQPDALAGCLSLPFYPLWVIIAIRLPELSSLLVTKRHFAVYVPKQHRRYDFVDLIRMIS